jgi:hypothetical protein
MMKTFFFLHLLCVSTVLAGQTIADFENFGLTTGMFLNNAGSSGSFQSGNTVLPNSYNADWEVWSGWAISATTDTQTPGYLNEYSAIAGGGVGGSTAYAVSYAFSPTNIHLTGDAAGGVVSGLYVTNSTYAYLSMKEGDAFAKKFGGITGNDPDFFLLTIKKFYNGQLSADSINFYLADYRFTDNSLDYLVKDWTWIELTSLGNADSLQFSLSSSDAGAFGMNTPAYFCVDDVQTADSPLSVEGELRGAKFTFFPNPATNYINVEFEENYREKVTLYDGRGVVVLQQPFWGKTGVLDVSFLNSGVYFLKAGGNNRARPVKILR